MPRRALINPFENVEGFDWNQANINKNLVKHNVDWKEAEEVFDNQPIIVAEDPKHSLLEQRYSARGKTNNNRKLTIIFTIRNNSVRIISARDQNRGERSQYEKAEANSKI